MQPSQVNTHFAPAAIGKAAPLGSSEDSTMSEYLLKLEQIRAELSANRAEKVSVQERHVEDNLVETLEADGRHVRRQVQCYAGIADVVTEEAIYEVKLDLSRPNIFQAVGQVLLYRQAINPNLKPYIAGRDSYDNGQLLSFCEELGIGVVTLNEIGSEYSLDDFKLEFTELLISEFKRCPPEMHDELQQCIKETIEETLSDIEAGSF
jgi:hypothetical protein